MDEQEWGAGQRLTWLIALGISAFAMVWDFLFTPDAPLVAPHVCAAALGMRLPRRPFLLLCALLACAIALPMLADLAQGSEAQITHRTVGLVCLLVIAAGRLFPSWLEGDYSLECELAELAEEPKPSAPSTEIRVTQHRVIQNPDADISYDIASDGDHFAPVMQRIESHGLFDSEQLKVIDAEMRKIEVPGVAGDFASSLQKGIQIGRFVIDEPLGRGGEGHVYRGHDESGEPAAIKILHNMRVSDRFRREMHLVRQLAHPNIVTAYEVGEFRGLPFITMELLQGPDLHVHVRDSGPLHWSVSTQYILQMARALAHAHRRDLVHRDIKPGNLILNGDHVVKLVDLGLAVISGGEGGIDSVFQFETQEGHLAGTLPYMAPEQARSLANATVRSDIYGLGATWYYMMTGRERLRGKTFSKQFENLLVRRRFNALPDECMPQSLRDIYRKMVAYDFKDRYDSCEVLADEIERALETSGQVVSVAEGINVLVVEDSRTDMLFTIEMLRRSNSTLTIHKARTLADGMDVCRQMSIDLVLLDLSLPDSSGVETVSKFREAVHSVPLVILTGMTQDEVGAECIEAGADTFVSKNGLTAHRMERTIFVTLSRCGLMRKAST